LGWLKLIIQVSPIFFDDENLDMYYDRTREIQSWLINKMFLYLLGESIKIQGRISSTVTDGAGLITSLEPSAIRKSGSSFFTSITVKNQHASFVEFGTGMHGQLVGSGDVITTRMHKVNGKMVKPKALHWTDTEGDHFFYSVRGQYPKPFMRGAVMKLKYQKDLIAGYEIHTSIVYPRSANFERTYGGKG